MYKHIIINAPPSSGKDAFAEYLTSKPDSGFVHREFKTALYALLKVIYDVTDEDIRHFNHESRKNERVGVFKDNSLRGALIDISENLIKPFYGKSFFGEKAGVSAIKSESNTIWSDGGFAEELESFSRILQESESVHTIRVVQLYRPGRTFKNDSRTYLSYDTILRYTGHPPLVFFNHFETANEYVVAFEKFLKDQGAL